MRIDTLLLSEIEVFPELFLGISIVYLVLHCTFLSIKNNYVLIQSSVVFLGSLVIFLSFCLLLNDSLVVLGLNSFNNTIINDYLSFTAKGFTAILSLFCLLIIKNYLLSQKFNNFEYVLLILFSVLGLFLLCSSNDLITAYLAIELQSLSFYVLAAFKKNSSFSVDAGVKYFIVGALSSSLFLFGSSLLYCNTGTVCFSDYKDLFDNYFFLEFESISHFNTKNFIKSLYWEFNLKNYDDAKMFLELCGLQNSEFIDEMGLLSIYMRETMFYSYLKFELVPFFDSQNLDLIKFGLILILISLFLKLAIAPFHTWSPDVYENSPSPSTFLFSVVPKFVVFVLLIRIFYLSFNSFIDSWRYFIVVVVVLTVIVGSFGGLEQRKLKSLLIYSSIGHMGYSLISFSVGTFESMQILLSYLLIYGFSGLCVWTIFISMRIKTNYFQKQNKDLTDLVSLSKSNNTLALIFSIVLFSVAGFPPMIGFLVKISVFLSAIESFMFFVPLICILCSVVSTFYYIRIVKILFFEKTVAGKLFYPINYFNSISISLFFYFFIFLFVNPTLLFLFSYKLSLLTML